MGDPIPRGNKGSIVGTDPDPDGQDLSDGEHRGQAFERHHPLHSRKKAQKSQEGDDYGFADSCIMSDN